MERMGGWLQKEATKKYRWGIFPLQVVYIIVCLLNWEKTLQVWLLCDTMLAT